jgi:hypothetical protein
MYRWSSIYTFQDHVIDEDADVLHIPQTLVCQSHQYHMYFTVGLLTIQAILLLWGAFLAVQTRKVM